MQRKSLRQRLLLIALLTTLLALPGCALFVVGGAAGAAAGGAASAESSQRESHSAATYAGTILANVFYFPAKVLFAAGGGVVSGLTYVLTLGSDEPAGGVWRSAVEGNYVLSPRMMEGREPVRFVGP